MKQSRKAKHFFLIYLLCLLCSAASGQSKLNAYQSLFQTDTYLKQWAAGMPHFKLSAFNYSRTADFENMLTDDSLPNNDRNFQQTFGKLISYSPDKKKYLDFYSGQLLFDTVVSNGKKKVTVSADVDQYLFLGDCASKKLRRIMFNGSTVSLEEAVWISDNTFILAGTTSADNSFYPFLYVGDVKKRQLRYYLPDDKNIKRDTLYRSPRWKNVKGVAMKDL